MRQYNELKALHPDAILLFRVGDFYETFGEDAVKASEILGITLTRRSNGAASDTELAGFPHHSIDLYLPRLTKAGVRVAVVEQLEDPKKTKTLVRRGVTEIVTPGISLNDKLLELDQNNFLAAIHFAENNLGLALLDLSTGEFFVAEGNEQHILNILAGLKPAELLFAKSQKSRLESLLPDPGYTYHREDWIFTYDFAEGKITDQFKTSGLKGFGIENWQSGTIAAGAILHYLEESKQLNLSHINGIRKLELDEFLWLDAFSVRNLEITDSNHPKGRSLYDVLNHTRTPMGARLLRKWLLLPSRDIGIIESRHEIVGFLHSAAECHLNIRDLLKSVGDLERLISRISLSRATPRELKSLQHSLNTIKQIKDECMHHAPLLSISGALDSLEVIQELLDKSIADDAPALLTKGNVIKAGYNEELDSYRNLAHSGKDVLLRIQQEESARTGIPSLKIGFNNVFGYYLEVTNAHKNKVPADWIRKATLTNAERYITPEIKEYEDKILNAESRIAEIEAELYVGVMATCAKYTQKIQQNAAGLAEIDCLSSFAHAAGLNNYVKPEMHTGLELQIEAGRHPVIELSLKSGEPYISNDVSLSNDDQQIIIITGPNMSGKSAILRQTALIVLMAHAGSFVPAQAARIPVTDKIFSRVGASDNLSIGESTFMVEMSETANILNNLTARSLIILDEIGRGTATYDGISIAWAITEYLHNHSAQPKTLFATHYHELNEIHDQFSRIANYHVSVKELSDRVIFLRKLLPGGSAHSFGIHVARLAGIPKEVVTRAQEILTALESERAEIASGTTIHASTGSPQLQLRLFDQTDTVALKLKEDILKIDLNSTSPMEALLKISQLQNFLKKNV